MVEKIAEILRRHGEVLVYTASGECWEVHLGDDPELLNEGIRFTTGDNETHLIAYEHIERVSYHKAHRM